MRNLFADRPPLFVVQFIFSIQYESNPGQSLFRCKKYCGKHGLSTKLLVLRCTFFEIVNAFFLLTTFIYFIQCHGRFYRPAVWSPLVTHEKCSAAIRSLQGSRFLVGNFLLDFLFVYTPNSEGGEKRGGGGGVFSK